MVNIYNCDIQIYMHDMLSPQLPCLYFYVFLCLNVCPYVEMYKNAYISKYIWSNIYTCDIHTYIHNMLSPELPCLYFMFQFVYFDIIFSVQFYRFTNLIKKDLLCYVTLIT